MNWFFRAALLLIISVGFLGNDARAPAGDAPLGILRIFEKWDVNRDGRLSTSEWRGRRPLSDFDTNGDGFVTKDEVRSLSSGVSSSSKAYERLLRFWDTDGDGKISRTEWRGKAPFEQWDGNADGFVSAEEMTRVTAPMPPAQTEGVFYEMLQKMDSNGDGKISRAEWEGSGAQFEATDQNVDGYITAEEVAASQSAHPGPF